MLENASFVICWNMFCIVDIISFTFLCKNTELSNIHKEKGCFSCENGFTEQLWFPLSD